MAFRMQCVQFQSQAPSDPDESLHSPLPSEPSASGQQTEDPASVDGGGRGGGGRHWSNCLITAVCLRGGVILTPRKLCRCLTSMLVKEVN